MLARGAREAAREAPVNARQAAKLGEILKIFWQKCGGGIKFGADDQNQQKRLHAKVGAEALRVVVL